MPRDRRKPLVWLEDSTFTAWACSACFWILPNPGLSESSGPPAKVAEAFDHHECANFPRRDRNLQPFNEPSNCSGSHLTQTGSGKVQLLSSPELNVAVMSCMTKPHCEQILCLDALGASEVRSALTICRAELSKLASCQS